MSDRKSLPVELDRSPRKSNRLTNDSNDGWLKASLNAVPTNTFNKHQLERAQSTC